MVDTKTKSTTVRARVAHKLAKYVRAQPVNSCGIRGTTNPSTSHIGKPLFMQHWEEPPRKELETVPTPGTPLMMRKPDSKEHPKYPKRQLPESKFKKEMLSSSFQESAEEEELWSSKDLSPATF